jgi:hypothetical protein
MSEVPMSKDDRGAQPAPRWNPGARYRPSVLAALPPEPVAAPGEPLPGRLFRGPARRTAIFDRDLWQPGRAGHAHVADALAVAAERYRNGGLDTSGLVRAVGHALAS